MQNLKLHLLEFGEDNKFGHPSDIVLKRLESINCKIYRTDLNGEICVKIKNKIIIVDNNFL